MSVSKLAEKARPHGDLLRPDENPFSTNRVTGHSLNVPIVGTCTPSTVCSETCYFAKGPATWPDSLAKQYRLLNSMRHHPLCLADVIAKWARKLRLTFIRWNGGGDLVEESIACIDSVALQLPDVPQWIVSRKPGLASRVVPRPNVFVHFSVDRSSTARLDEMRRLTSGSDLQWFHSYQCDRGEIPPAGVAPVIFRDGYDLAGSEPVAGDCPLNSAESIENVCASCRRCFNGEALSWR